jgi:xanthine dehydrogenase molybdopterin-binding subunit B
LTKLFRSEYPVGEPIPKLSALIQASGEAKYTADAAPLPGTLHAAHVVATMANATIASIDPSAAIQLPGVVAFFSAKDLPEGKNAWGPQVQDEEVFASTQVHYYGQPVGMIVADTREHAIQAASAVVVNYTNVQTPILSLEVRFGLWRLYWRFYWRYCA